MARPLTLLLTAAAAACLLTVTRAEPLGCIDPDGNAVDWYVIYKLPCNVEYTYNIGTKRAKKTTEGTEYLFLSPSSSDQSWKWKTCFGNDAIDIRAVNLVSSDSALRRTMKPCYGIDKRYDVFEAYNDQPKKNVSKSNYGHSKQILAKSTAITEGPRGFWLFHTMPRFPKAEGDIGDIFDTNVKRNGQTFLCMTMTSDEDWRDAKAYITEVNAYRYIPTTVQGKRKNQYELQKANAENFFTNSDTDFLTPTATPTPQSAPSTPTPLYPACPQMKILNMASSNIITDAYVKKDTVYGECDLYKAAAEKLTVSSFGARTWRMRPEQKTKLDLDSSLFSTVIDIEYIQFESSMLSEGVQVSKFRSTKDHTKWAMGISNDKEKNVCFGDHNHNLVNMERAGGMVCSTNELLFKAFEDLPEIS